jgi:hypothetical protein
MIVSSAFLNKKNKKKVGFFFKKIFVFSKIQKQILLESIVFLLLKIATITSVLGL